MRDSKLTKWRKTCKILKKPWARGWEWKRECLGDEQAWTDRERSKKWETDCEGGLNRTFNNARQMSYWEVSRKLLREVSREWSSTAEVSSNKESISRTEARSIHQVSKSYRGGRSFLDWSTRYRGSVEIVIRNSLKARQIAKCWEGVEKVSRLLKNSFLRREKHRYECNQACNSTKDPINILSSQNHLSTTILST